VRQGEGTRGGFERATALSAGLSRPGRLMAIGGAEDREGDSELLRVFAGLAGGPRARIALITTASGVPEDSFAAYSAAFRRLGVHDVRELRMAGPEQADGEQTLTGLARATGVFLTGGDQARLRFLVGSRANRLMRERLADGTLAVAGTSAGATALGSVMILSGDGRPGSLPRTGPGLGLLPGAIIDMHFAQRHRLPRLVAAVGRYPAHLGIGVDEDTAIVTRTDGFGVLGRGAVATVDLRAPGARLHRLRAGDAFGLERRAPDRGN
jgi:cyanophycinase